jgi:hypothetical protein
MGCPLAQIVTAPGKKKTVLADDVSTSLVEVGPRVCLQPVKIFSGSFEGQILYENPAYVSPNKVWPPSYAFSAQSVHGRTTACAFAPVQQ